MKHLIILILLALHLTVFGQHNFGLKLNGGLSRISNSVTPINSTMTVKFAPSFNSGLFYYLQLTNKYFLNTELLFTQIGGKEKLEFNLIDIDGNTAGNGIGNINKSISYISLPVYFGLKYNKFIINIGFKLSFKLAGSEKANGQATYNGKTDTWDSQYEYLDIDTYDIGPRVGLIYNLNNKCDFEVTYYYGVNNLLEKNDLNRTWRVQQAVIGIRYALFNTE